MLDSRSFPPQAAASATISASTASEIDSPLLTLSAWPLGGPVSADGLKRKATPTLMPGESLAQTQALRLELRAGERWFVLGPNGVGKSTLLRGLAGLLTQPRAALVWHEQHHDGLVDAGVWPLAAWCPQHASDVFAITVRNWLQIATEPAARAWRWTTPARIDALTQLLRRFGLDALALRDVRTLSGGERQRLSLAATMGRQARLYCLDEPTAHIDIGQRQALMRSAFTWPRRGLPAWMVATHDLDLAAVFATHVLLIRADRCWRAGKASEYLTAEHLGWAFGCEMLELISPAGKRFCPG